MPSPIQRLISLEGFRNRLAAADALPQLCILGLLVGVIAGMVMLLFRLAVDVPLEMALPGNDSEHFEGLDPLVRFLLPAAGGLLIGLALQLLRPADREVGVVHVMERLASNQGQMPLRNAVVQFFAGAAALLTGQSSGREGPAVHLGAASSSVLGQLFGLPNNSIRTLVACGTAAAIAGSFNTPLAGVIFAMEVVMMEYTITSFVPVILSAVAATLLGQAAYGNHTAFDVPDAIRLGSLTQIPLIVFEGILIGTLAAAFIRITGLVAKTKSWPYWTRPAAGGLLTGAVAYYVPSVMGIGYDTVESALAGSTTLTLLITIAFAKLVVSAATAGFRMPAGIIGPTLVIGACAGGVVAQLAKWLHPETASPDALFVLLGMAAMMGAVLQAPLAALLAVIELSGNPNITMSAMLTIVVATVTSRVLFRQQSIYLVTLASLGLRYPLDPVSQHLQRIGVMNIMDRRFARLRRHITLDDARRVLAREPKWLVVENDDGANVLMSANTLVTHLKDTTPESSERIDLVEIGGTRVELANIDAQATAQQANMTMDLQEVEALCVRRSTSPTVNRILGVITRGDIQRFSRTES